MVIDTVFVVKDMVVVCTVLDVIAVIVVDKVVVMRDVLIVSEGVVVGAVGEDAGIDSAFEAISCLRRKYCG